MNKEIKIGVIGSGAMGTGIAQVASTFGHAVKVFDVSDVSMDKSKSSLQKVMKRLVEKGKFDRVESARIVDNIEYIEALKYLKDCDLIIEAIIENAKIKKETFRKLEKLVDKNCIIASNTSSLGITDLASSLEDPSRFIGIHFFNPAPVMKLVEIVPALQTDEKVIHRCREIIAAWNKSVVIAKDTPGFIVNKIARPFYSEALRILEEGIASIDEIDLAMTEVGGFKMGPFTLMDYIGHDVNYAVTESVYKAFYYDGRYKPSFTQKRLVEAGYLGRKSGRVFYSYPLEPIDNANLNEKLANQIVERIVVMLINEAADTLHVNIASKEDIETAMTKGVNYPKGLLQWADQLGIEHCVNVMDRLFDEYHEERYRCSPLMRKLVRNGESFFQNDLVWTKKN